MLGQAELHSKTLSNTHRWGSEDMLSGRSAYQLGIKTELKSQCLHKKLGVAPDAGNPSTKEGRNRRITGLAGRSCPTGTRQSDREEHSGASVHTQKDAQLHTHHTHIHTIN